MLITMKRQRKFHEDSLFTRVVGAIKQRREKTEQTRGAFTNDSSGEGE